jgi:prephenate dehydrogenase
VSSAYVQSPRLSFIRAFPQDSFSTLRGWPKLNETMWTELFIDNKDCLVPEIDGIKAA